MMLRTSVLRFPKIASLRRETRPPLRDPMLSEQRQRPAPGLFGSRAQDEHLTWSDDDVCVIFDDFAGMRHPKLLRDVWQRP